MFAVPSLSLPKLATGMYVLYAVGKHENMLISATLFCGLLLFRCAHLLDLKVHSYCSFSSQLRILIYRTLKKLWTLLYYFFCNLSLLPFLWYYAAVVLNHNLFCIAGCLSWVWNLRLQPSNASVCSSSSCLRCLSSNILRSGTEPGFHLNLQNTSGYLKHYA